MRKEEVIIAINQFLVEDFEIEEKLLVPESYITKDLNIDSLDIVDITVRVNEVFGIKLTKEECLQIAY